MTRDQDEPEFFHSDRGVVGGLRGRVVGPKYDPGYVIERMVEHCYMILFAFG